MVAMREFKHRIAAHFEVNVWRIYEVKEGKLHPGSEAAAAKLRGSNAA